MQRARIHTRPVVQPPSPDYSPPPLFTRSPRAPARTHTHWHSPPGVRSPLPRATAAKRSPVPVKQQAHFFERAYVMRGDGDMGAEGTYASVPPGLYRAPIAKQARSGSVDRAARVRAAATPRNRLDHGHSPPRPAYTPTSKSARTPTVARTPSRTRAFTPTDRRRFTPGSVPAHTRTHKPNPTSTHSPPRIPARTPTHPPSQTPRAAPAWHGPLPPSPPPSHSPPRPAAREGTDTREGQYAQLLRMIDSMSDVRGARRADGGQTPGATPKGARTPRGMPELEGIVSELRRAVPPPLPMPARAAPPAPPPPRRQQRGEERRRGEGEEGQARVRRPTHEVCVMCVCFGCVCVYVCAHVLGVCVCV